MKTECVTDTFKKNLNLREMILPFTYILHLTWKDLELQGIGWVIALWVKRRLSAITWVVITPRWLNWGSCRYLGCVCVYVCLCVCDVYSYMLGSADCSFRIHLRNQKKTQHVCYAQTVLLYTYHVRTNLYFQNKWFLLFFLND